MKAWFQKLIDVSSVAPTDATIKQALPELVRGLGFDCFAFLHVQPIRTCAVSNYPAEWQERYLGRDYAKIDPVVAMARSRLQAFAWMAGKPRQAANKAVRTFYAEAGDFGIRSGISVPIRTAFGHMSMLTLASSKPAVSLKSDIDQVAAVTSVALLHAALEHHDAEPTAARSVELTAKQALCLKWSAEGKSMRAIATIENMSYANVNFHLNNARKTLDASSLAQATALATKLKLI
ncbi:autoinducer binding domain-containing protein [Aminobacter aminovorans]|uniref:Autoinducer-binding domain protein n=1 Tax=Aminobacter aminovorans TaxID=83263 RepID=A0AAC8YW69_AMIAI|nr:autoinducer binding domain-containing protein [Aminobacter aminovorans]AMS45528.1 Autoinducer-binding domain protein [Aminobacter aminovorans]MBB3708603.1 LuxR family transcriptional activator of conjugal transfer of Ti plasmids [Aminobacter aminovorans]